MRYRHYLMRPTRNYWPRDVYCVAVDASWEVEPAMDQPGRETLTGWTLIRLEYVQGQYAIKWTMERNTLTEWQSTLRQIAQCRGQVWLLSYQCARVWSLLGLWEGVEDGRYGLCGYDPRTDPKAMAQVSSVRGHDEGDGLIDDGPEMPIVPEGYTGILITEDPPNIARFKAVGTRGEVVWIDLRNYGIELPGNASAANGTALLLMQAWSSMAAQCHRYQLGSAQTTVASQAMHGWRRTYMPTGIYAHADPDVMALEAESFYGGRAECYQLGQLGKPVVHYDIRSSYGHVMQTEELPTRLISYYDNAEAAAWIHSLGMQPCIADVDLCTDEPSYPMGRNGIVIWPVGTFRTILAWPELLDAYSRGRVVKVHRVATYELQDATASYAAAAWSIRQDAKRLDDTLLEQWAKRLLVSLPGKLGQRERRWTVVAEPGNVPPYGEWYGRGPDGTNIRYKSVAGNVFADERLGFSPDAVPAMASWITSAGRMHLLRLIRAAGWEHTYYVDTDSLIVDRAGAIRIEACGYQVGDNMGQLHVLYEGRDVFVHAIKHYREGKKVVFAGQPSGVMVDAGDGVHYYYTPPPDAWLKEQRMPQADQLVFRYPVGTHYYHGRVDPSGKVSPIVLGKGTVL